MTMADAPKSQDSIAETATEVEVVYAAPNITFSRAFRMSRNGTLLDAVRQSGLLERYPEIDLAAGVGVYGQVLPPETLVRACQAEARVRIEVYRPLKQPPTEARRRRQLAPQSPRRKA